MAPIPKLATKLYKKAFKKFYNADFEKCYEILQILEVNFPHCYRTQRTWLKKEVISRTQTFCFEFDENPNFDHFNSNNDANSIDSFNGNKVPKYHKDVHVDKQHIGKDIDNEYANLKNDTDEYPNLKNDTDEYPNLKNDTDEYPNLKNDTDEYPNLKNDTDEYPNLNDTDENQFGNEHYINGENGDDDVVHPNESNFDDSCGCDHGDGDKIYTKYEGEDNENTDYECNNEFHTNDEYLENEYNDDNNYHYEYEFETDYSENDGEFDEFEYNDNEDDYMAHDTDDENSNDNKSFQSKQSNSANVRNINGVNVGSSSTDTIKSYTSSQLALVRTINEANNYYEVLNVTHTTKITDIKKAYRQLALQLHPDKNHAPGASGAFRTIKKAVETLIDSDKRFNYNRNLGIHRNHNNCIDKKEFEAEYEKRSVYQTANARMPQYSIDLKPKYLIMAIIVGFLLAILANCVIQAGDYRLEENRYFNQLRFTQFLHLPYYVKPNFEERFQDSLNEFDQKIEKKIVNRMKKRCEYEIEFREMDDLIEKLKTTSVSPTTTADNTTTLLSEISATKDPKLFDKHDLAELFLNLTKSEDSNIRKEAAKCIAEITKSEVQRKKFTQTEIINSFIDCLKDLPTDGKMELPIQICRALGNICYLNDEARDIILELKGDAVLVKLLDLVNIGDTSNSVQFIKVRGGLLSNYLLGGEGLAKRTMDLDIMGKIQNIITLGVSNVEEHEDLLLNTLPLLSILTENVADLNFDSNLNIQLSRILAASTNPDLAEMCLELLHYQAENDDVKLLLAKDGLCETIYNLLEKYKTLASTNEARALMKLACELIVLILTGDESMHFLYSTSLLKNMEDWLDSNDIDLLTTGVLALGNFARTDSHCIYMVENNVMNKLLHVLSKNNGVKDDVRLQHALLSALRNLVIPKPNKNAVIQAGLVQTILPMLEIHQPPVVFKLLGTLRMTVDCQEDLALELLKNKTLIEQLVHWSKSSDYAGVTGESLRLMAWLIKHAYLNKIAYALPRKGDAPIEQFADKLPEQQKFDRSSLTEFISNEGTIEAMINMLTSQHLVMQNEALIALCILSVVYLNNSKTSDADVINLQGALIKYEVGKKLAELIKKSSDTMTKEIVENLQNCINLLKISDKLVEHLEENNINELLKTIPILTEYCTL